MHQSINLPTKGETVPPINLMIQPTFLLNQFFDNINYQLLISKFRKTTFCTYFLSKRASPHVALCYNLSSIM